MARAREKVARIADVARLSGVSTTTVSFVLNNTGSVSEETRRRVLDAVERLGYHPNDAARSLPSGRTRRVAILVPQIGHLNEDPYFARALSGIHDALEERDHSVVLKRASVEFLREKEHIGILRRREVDGLLVVGATVHDTYLTDFAGRPVVLVNAEAPNVRLPSVLADNVEGAVEGVRHLIELGHRRIAHVAGSLDTPGGRDRLDGYKKALAAAGMAFEEDLVVEADFLSPWRTGREATRALLARFADVPAERRPTALFCANDLVAIGAIEALKAAGRRVPHDTSVVGADDIAAAADTEPPLTTVHVPTYEIAREAVGLLLDLVQAPEGLDRPPERTVLPTRLVRRASSAPPPGGRA